MFPLLTRIDKSYLPRGLVGIIAPWNYPLSPTDLRRSGRSGRRQRRAAQTRPADPVRSPGRRRPAAPVGHAGRSLAGRLRARSPGGRRADQPRRLPLLHRVDGDRADCGQTVCRPADRLLAGAGRQEPAGRARRRRPRAGGRGRGPGLVQQRRPALRLRGADLRRRPGAARRSPSTFVAKTRALRLGRSLDYEYDMGSLVSIEQLERVESHVEDARSKGAQVLTGGRRRPDLGPLFYEPTVLTGVTEEMDCYAAETFGPVVSIYPVRRRGRGRAASQRLRVRAQRQRLDLRPGARASGRCADPVRHGERQRGVRRHLRQHRARRWVG